MIFLFLQCLIRLIRQSRLPQQSILERFQFARQSEQVDLRATNRVRQQVQYARAKLREKKKGRHSHRYPKLLNPVKQKFARVPAIEDQFSPSSNANNGGPSPA